MITHPNVSVVSVDSTPGKSLFWFCITVAAWAVAIAFPARLVWYLSLLGENCPSYDYVDYIRYIDRLFRGETAWYRMPLDTVIIGGSHCMMLPTLVRLALIALTDWSMHAEIALGVVFAGIKWGLLFVLFGRGLERRYHAILAVLLSGMIFSLGHFDSFQFGAAGMNQQLADVCFLAGVWCVIRKPRGWLVGMILGGIGASWSYGSGVLSWPVFLVGFLLTDEKSRRNFVVWAMGAAFAAVPYVWFRLTSPLTREFEGNLFPVTYWMQSLTQPFHDVMTILTQPGTWKTIGSLAAVLLLALGAWAYRQFWKTDRSRLAPPVMCLLYSLGTLWLISAGRSGMAPWYSVHFAMFWIGLLGLAFVSKKPGSASEDDEPARFSHAWRWVMAFILGGLLIPANRSLAGKAMFLPALSPAAMTAFREYRTAPTTYTYYPYPVWRGNHAFLVHHAQILERHGWAMFGRHRTHLLQGEFGLPTVTLSEPDTPGSTWVHDRGAAALPFTHYERLNLRLPIGNSLSWKISIPQETESARLITAVAAGGPGASRTELLLGSGNGAVSIWNSDISADGDWKPCEVDLSEHAGRTVELAFRAASDDPQASPVIWRTPQIDINLKSIPKPSGAPVIPANTDPTLHPPFTDQDIRLANGYDMWAMPEPQPPREPESPLKWSVTTGKTWLDYRGSIEIFCGHVSHLALECGLSGPIAESQKDWEKHWMSRVDPQPRDYLTVAIFGQLSGAEYKTEIQLPLQNDGQLHWYWLDLRKHELPRELVITKVTLAPTGGHVGLVREFQLSDIRFLRQPQE